MFENFLKRYVPWKLIPRRRRTEMLVKHFCKKSTGITFDKWVALGNKSEREANIYFDVIDEKLGAQPFADETFTLAITEAYILLAEWISRSDSFTPNTETTTQ